MRATVRISVSVDVPDEPYTASAPASFVVETATMSSADLARCVREHALKAALEVLNVPLLTNGHHKNGGTV